MYLVKFHEIKILTKKKSYLLGFVGVQRMQILFNQILPECNLSSREIVDGSSSQLLVLDPEGVDDGVSRVLGLRHVVLVVLQVVVSLVLLNVQAVVQVVRVASV